MATRISNPAIQHFDKSSGAQLAGGQMFFFETGTTTPKDVFDDSEETTALTNPVILDGTGFEPDIFGTGSYRIVLQNADGIQQYERDPVDFQLGTAAFNDWLGSVNYGIGDIVKGSDGSFYISLQSNNNNNDPTQPANAEFWTQFDLLNRWNTEENYFIGDVVRSTISGSIYTSVLDQDGNDPDTDDGTNWKFIDNVRITGNTITVDDIDGDLNLEPNGTGDLLTGGEVIGLAQISQQRFTASGTWTKPANVRFIVLEMVGSGAGGESSGTLVAGRGGGGGGAGAYTREVIDVTSIASSTLIIGLGGAAATSGNPTSFTSSTAIAGGGSVGGPGDGSANGGLGGTPSGGNATAILIFGGDGDGGSSDIAKSGSGGASYFGGGGRGVGIPSQGRFGQVPGSGGSGGANDTGADTIGGIGADGLIIVTEYR